MAVAVDSGNEVRGDAVSSLTTPSFTIAGDNRAVIVVASDEENGTPNSVTCGGISLSAISSGSISHSTQTRRIVLFGAAAPNTGSTTAYCAWGSTDNYDMVLAAVSFSGADQTSPFQNANTAEGGDDAVTVTVSSVAADDFVVDGIRAHVTKTVGTNQTAQCDLNHGSVSTQDGADGGAMTWTLDEANAWVSAACRVVAVASAASSTPSSTPSTTPSTTPSSTPSSTKSSTPSATPSATPSTTPSSGDVTTGTTCWGHFGGAIDETNNLTFAGEWTGTGAITGSGTTENLSLDDGEYMQTYDCINTGAVDVTIQINKYLTGDTATVYYRHGASWSACRGASWNAYSTPFTSLGYVQIKVENPV